MVRKILAGLVIGLGGVLLLASVAGIGAVWGYNTPLTDLGLAQLAELDAELSLAQVALENAQAELTRTLRIVSSAEETLSALKEEVALARQLFDEVDATLDNSLIPALQGSRGRVDEAKSALEDLRGSLDALNAIPFINLSLPGDELLANLVAIADAIDSEIVRVEDLAKKASTFADDASYLMGGDLGETRQNLQNLLDVVTAYEQRVTAWRAQIAGWSAALPGWIDTASMVLTVFLAWFGLSNASLVLHGLAAWQGSDPFAVLRRKDSVTK